MPDSTRGSIYISTADEIGETLVEKLGGSGYTPNEWDKSINLCGISDADIPTALENIENSADGTERGSFEITKANAIASVLNKKYKTTRGFKPKEWASAVDKLTALQIKNASGAIASFTDGADDVPIASASFSIVPYQNLNGYSKPWASGCGKNILEVQATTTTKNNVTFTVYSDGTVVCNGIASALTPFPLRLTDHKVQFENGVTYTLSGCPVGGSDQTYQLDLRTTNSTGGFYKSVKDYGSGYTWTDDGGSAYVIILIRSGYNCQNLTFKPMIEKGSSATSFEPYSNVCPITPYSQMTITHTKKNLIKSEKYQASQTILTLGQSDNSSFGTFLKAGTYTISYSTSGDTCYIYRREQNDSSNINIGKGSSKSFTIDKDGYFRFWLFGDGAISENISNVMLEVGSSQTTFSPYSPPEVIGDNFGRSVYGGSRASDGTLTETMESITFNGSDSENWSAGTVGTYRRTFMSTALKLTTCLDNLKCDRIEPSNTSENVNRDMTCRSTSYLSNRFYVFVPLTFTEITDLTSFKTWLSNNPVKVCYPPTTPTEYALDPLPEINSYYGDNNIYTDIIDGESSVNYRADIDLSQ